MTKTFSITVTISGDTSEAEELREIISVAIHNCIPSHLDREIKVETEENKTIGPMNNKKYNEIIQCCEMFPAKLREISEQCRSAKTDDEKRAAFWRVCKLKAFVDDLVLAPLLDHVDVL